MYFITSTYKTILLAAVTIYLFWVGVKAGFAFLILLTIYHSYKETKGQPIYRELPEDTPESEIDFDMDDPYFVRVWKLIKRSFRGFGTCVVLYLILAGISNAAISTYKAVKTEAKLSSSWLQPPVSAEAENTELDSAPSFENTPLHPKDDGQLKDTKGRWL